MLHVISYVHVQVQTTTHVMYQLISDMTMLRLICCHLFLQRKIGHQLVAAAAAPVTVAEQNHPQPEQDKDEMEVETELFIGLPGRGRS